MQTDGFTSATGQKYKSTLDCVRIIWKTEGLPAFTRGLGPTLIRYVLGWITFSPCVPHLMNFTVRPLPMEPLSWASKWRRACLTDCNPRNYGIKQDLFIYHLAY